ncbi:hypothetical protein DFH07DRAFT_507572 [Mycena maculata]|uniref:Uncharacterized protein n=1 Tax=Mycena maculata TaxID=230809 RepID=A0AAD7NXU1_9AGAR|nr:hypothetical protein DFH07DRAFT_507572 [Mycena maculata]
MDEDLIADPGYESDTGPRDNPTCANFLKKQPVQKTIEVGAGKKVLNRTGRAICRILYAHSYSAAEIARIFDISSTSVSRAIENIRYIPRDRVSEDYGRVDPEFAVHFPPVANLRSPDAADGRLDETKRQTIVPMGDRCERRGLDFPCGCGRPLILMTTSLLQNR